jgi:hypothetical protein
MLRVYAHHLSLTLPNLSRRASPGPALHGNIDLPEALGCAREAEAVLFAFVGLILVCVLSLRRWRRELEQGQGEAAANHSSVASVGVG